jgi:hypothetical protein
MSEKKSVWKRIIGLYVEGFRHMPSWGKKLWLIILIKAFIMFAVFKLFFFPNYLKTNFSNDEERSKHVIEQLTNP